ncbi:MAG: TonB-dependent receptor [Steroidobacteraceae bacterium]
MRTKQPQRWPRVVLLAAASVSISTAFAQVSGGLEEITVTARKVTENQQTVPVSLTALSATELERASATQLIDVEQLAPGLVMSASPTTESALTIQLRGQQQNDTLATLDPSVGLYVDGVYWARAYGLNADLLDIKSVQVLNGPQGTLFGRNTTGGALVLETENPNLESSSGRVSGTFGRYDEVGATAVLNLPVIENKLGVRLALQSNDRDGYIRNTNTGSHLGEKNSWTARGKVLFQATEALSTLFSAEVFDMDVKSTPLSAKFIAPPTATNPLGSFVNQEAGTVGYGSVAGLGPYTVPPEFSFATSTPTAGGIAFFQQMFARSQLGAPLVQAYIDSAQGDTVGLNTDAPVDVRTRTFSNTTTYDAGWGAIKFIAAYRDVAAHNDYDFDGTPWLAVSAELWQDLNQWSGELQMTGNALDDKLSFATGLFYFAEYGDDRSQQVGFPSFNPTLPMFDGTVNNKSAGIYSQGSYRVTEKLGVTAGLRYSYDEKALTSRNRTVLPPALGGGLFSCDLPGAPNPCEMKFKDDFSAVSYTLGMDYRVTDDVMVYLKTGKGFRSGGQNLRGSAVTGSFAKFDPEEVRDIEAGLKSQFWDNRARLNAAVYYSENKDLQRSTAVTDASGQSSTVVQNAGKARVIGSEVQLTLQATEHLLLGAGAAYTDPKYKSFRDPQTGADRSNELFSGVAKWTANVNATYTQPISLGNLTLRADYSWRDDVVLWPWPKSDPNEPFNDAIVDATTDEATGVLNARAALSVMDDTLEFAIWGSNLTDERDSVGGTIFAAPVTVVNTRLRDPRTYGVTVSYRFGQ